MAKINPVATAHAELGFHCNQFWVPCSSLRSISSAGLYAVMICWVFGANHAIDKSRAINIMPSLKSANPFKNAPSNTIPRRVIHGRKESSRDSRAPGSEMPFAPLMAARILIAPSKLPALKNTQPTTTAVRRVPWRLLNA